MLRSGVFFRLVACVGWLAQLACGEADEAGSGIRSPAATHVPGCEALEHAPCHIERTACQNRLAELAACIWGGPQTPVVKPPVSLVSQEAFQTMVLAALEDESEEGVNGHWDQALILLGFATADLLESEATAERSAERIAGFYDHEEQTITIVTRDSDSPQLAWDSAVLLHELFHALQDDANDLADLKAAQPLGMDASLALSNIVEGEAEFHTTRGLAAMFGLDFESLDLAAAIRNLRQRYEARVFEDPYPFLQIGSLANYGYGPEYVASVWRQSSRSGVRELFEAPPTSFHRAFALVNGAEPVEFEAVQFAEPTVPDGVEASVNSWTTLGPAGLWVLFRGENINPALSWRGDQLEIFELGDGATALRWRFEFVDAMAAMALATHGIAPGVQTRAAGVFVEAVAATGEVPDWLPEL